MFTKVKISLLIIAVVLIAACDSSSDGDSLYTGNEVNFELISGEFEGNTTSGNLTVKERTDGSAEIVILLNGVIKGASHPVHLHFGSLSDDGLVATYLNQIEEVEGVGQSTTLLSELDNGTAINYNSMLAFDGSVKIHFESTGELKDIILGASNIGMNSAENEAFLLGLESISTCNSDFEGY